MASTLSEALVSIFLDHTLVLVMTASQLGKEILKSLSQALPADPVMVSGTLKSPLFLTLCLLGDIHL
jgi:hypothetical protein